MCYGRYECQDYCVWQQDGEPAGAWTGTIGINVFGVFGFDGWNVYKEVFKPAGNCYPGQVFIDIRNERTCANYTLRQVHLDCFGTGKITKLEQVSVVQGSDRSEKRTQKIFGKSGSHTVLRWRNSPTPC